jgi:virginiamycin B lyase
MPSSRSLVGALVAALALTLVGGASGAAGLRVQEYPVPPGTHPHDVAPAPDGTVWYTAQHTGRLGRLSSSSCLLHSSRQTRGRRGSRAR